MNIIVLILQNMEFILIWKYIINVGQRIMENGATVLHLVSD